MGAEPRSNPAGATRDELGVSIVTYHSLLAEIAETVRSLRAAAERARHDGRIARLTLWLVDNGSDDPAGLDQTVAVALGPTDQWIALRVLRGHGNVGYGRGHDLALEASEAPWHLVLNPDVIVAPDAISEGLAYLETNPDIGMITPHAVDRDGQRQFLCKRYPTVLVLALRGFAPATLRRRFRGVLDRYEMRDLPEWVPARGIPIASGCFMLARGDTLRRVGGFSSRYFLYFEDFDLSLRFRQVAEIAYLPNSRIVHTGGNAARKGWAHQRLFIRSALTFFGTHGWRLW
jgi:GT2 family glycosyltransferase